MTERNSRKPPTRSRPEAGINNGVGAALDQIDPFDLGKGTRPPITFMAAKNRNIGRRIGNIFGGAIDGH